MEEKKVLEIVFEEVNDKALFERFTGGCSGSRSDCCTRVCKKYPEISEKEWGEFLEVEGGVIQY